MFIWNWTSKVKGVEEFWTWMDKEGGGGRSLENWTMFMDVICVSSLISVAHVSEKQAILKWKLRDK